MSTPIEIPEGVNIGVIEKGLHNLEDAREPFWPKDRDPSKGHSLGNAKTVEEEYIVDDPVPLPALGEETPFIDEGGGPLVPNSPLLKVRPFFTASTAANTQAPLPKKGYSNTMPCTAIPDRAKTCSVIVDDSAGFEISQDYEAMVRHILGILSAAPARDQLYSLSSKVKELTREKLDVIQGRDKARDGARAQAAKFQEEVDQVEILERRLGKANRYAARAIYFAISAYIVACGIGLAWWINSI